MPTDGRSPGPHDAVRALDHVESLDCPTGGVDGANVESVGDGVNDVYVVDTGSNGTDPVVVKFGTLSTYEHLRTGVAANRALSAYTSLPLPAIHALDAGTDALSPFVVMEYVPGSPLASGFDDVSNLTDPGAVRLLGSLIDAFEAVPDSAIDGYGWIRDVEDGHGDAGAPRFTASHNDWPTWIVDYASRPLESPSEHPALEAIAPVALDYLQTNVDRLPATPSPALAITDLSPGNLMSPTGHPPETVDELSGVIDLERAKIAPLPFTAINAEYLLARQADDADVVREALYEQLPFGPDIPQRELYRVVALSRAVGGLSTWYDTGSDRYDRRAHAVARKLERIVR